MSRSEKKSPQGDRHRSDKEFKKIAAGKARAKDRAALASFDGDGVQRPLTVRGDDPYSIAWDGPKEDCHIYRSIEETRKEIRDAIEDAKKDLLGERWTRQCLPGSIEDMDWDAYFKLSRGPWKKGDPKPWPVVKRRMFSCGWNDKLLKALGIKGPNDLWRVTDRQVDEAAELLYRRDYLQK